MDTWVWHQVGLEFGNIDVKGTIESEGGSQGGDNLGNESVQVGVGWSLDIEVSSADIINFGHLRRAPSFNNNYSKSY